MARQRQSEDDQPPRRRHTRPPREPHPDMLDRRVIEGRMWGGLGGQTPDTPAARAQELMYEAFDQPNPEQRKVLARQALEIWPDCADAYVLLAEHAPTRKEALELYEQGVQAGERALGPEMFREQAGDFWGLLETRPYMRARAGLVDMLWTSGRREEAAAHLQDMLRLNPGDNQGNRYTLAGYLLALNRNDDLGTLLGEYGDDGAALWAYTRALLAYRLQGNTPHARALLKEAKKVNKHVLPYLLEEKFPPMELPPLYSPGDDSEAQWCLASSLAAWKETAGAIDWVREVLKTGKKQKTAQRRQAGPSEAIKERLRDLPQMSEVWQADFRRLPTVIKVGRHLQRPWVITLLSQESGMVLGSEVTEEEPSAQDIWDRLVRSMQRPTGSDPGRPAELQVRNRPAWRELAPHLEEVDIQVTFADPLDPLDDAFASLAEQMGENEPPSILDVPGMTPEKVGSFYAAAAEFFRQAPWRQVGYESAIRVECDKFQSGPWYGVLMGQSGLTMGLALYEDLKLLRRLWRGTLSDEQNARLTVATTVTFGPDIELALADVEAAQRYRWPVARPDAWPVPIRKERGMSMRSPLVWELELLEGCLRAIPEFVRKRRQDDTTPEEMIVPVASGPLKLRLKWIDEDT